MSPIVAVLDLRTVAEPVFLAEILVILKGFLDSCNEELSLPEVEEKYSPNPCAHRRV
jgi:hypothetical protein